MIIPVLIISFLLSVMISWKTTEIIIEMFPNWPKRDQLVLSAGVSFSLSLGITKLVFSLFGI